LLSFLAQEHLSCLNYLCADISAQTGAPL